MIGNYTLLFTQHRFGFAKSNTYMAEHNNLNERKLVAMIFTSGCSELDLIQSEVLATTARQFEFTHKITHLMYGCSDGAYRAFIKRKNPENRVETFLVSEISGWKEPGSSIFSYGDAAVTTTIHAQVLQKWMTTKAGLTLDDEENVYVVLVDSDSIFTKKIDFKHLIEEADEVENPRFFAQDAAWYMPRKQPFTDLEQRQLLDKVPFLKLGKLRQVKDWRLFGGRGPFVIERKTLFSKILPAAAQIWSALPSNKKQLVFPIAAAHHSEPMAISGALMIHHYVSRYENWDFADYIESNPCENGVQKDARALNSFPISIRAKNFTLPVWIDGRDWNFIDEFIPTDYFDCDAWLLREPSEKFWNLASTTKGYERVSTILRRRHAIGVFMAIRAYNDVARIYRRRFCSSGYNDNKNLIMGFNRTHYTTALPYSVAHASRRGQLEYSLWHEKVLTEDGTTSQRNGSDIFENEDLHFVFLTTCDPSQHWQSRVLVSSFLRVNHLGRLTRIVSGCDEASLRALLKKEPMHPRMQLHVADNYTHRPARENEKTSASFIDSYLRYSKPFGIRHWLRHANPPVLESTIILVEPDFIFLQPLLLDSRVRLTSAEKVISGGVDDMEVLEGLRQYKRFYVYEGYPSMNVTIQISNGSAIAQRLTSHIGLPDFDAENNIYSTICPECNLLNKRDKMKDFSVGSPYILSRKDLSLMIDDYCLMTFRLHEIDGTSQMDTYVLASSKNGIRHTIFDNLASGRIDRDSYPHFVTYIGEEANPCSNSDGLFIRNEMPVMLRSTHDFTAVDSDGNQWIYSVRLIPTDLFECDSWLLSLPPIEVWTIARDSKSTERMLQAYGLCTFIKASNQAIIEYKSKYCPDGYNVNKRLRLLDGNGTVM